MSYGTKKTDKGYTAKLIGFISLVVGILVLGYSVYVYTTNGFNFDEISSMLSFSGFALIVSIISFGFYFIVVKM